MSALSDFDRAVEKIDLEVAKAATTLQRKLVLKIATLLILATPVRTGAARSNWNTSIGVANFSVTDVVDTNGNKARQKAIAVSKSVKPGDVAYITNALPYIGKLNDGHSKQQPAGFIERSVLLANAEAKI